MRGGILFFVFYLCNAFTVNSAVLFELTDKRMPVLASGIASINQDGVVFSPEPGRADFVRHRWDDFTVKGLETLLSQMPLERAFLQKDSATKLQLIDFIRAEITFKLSKVSPPVEVPVKPVVEVPVKPVVEVPVKPVVEVPVKPVVEVPVKSPNKGGQINVALNRNQRLEKPIIGKHESGQKSSKDNGNLGVQFSLVPGPVIPAPPQSKLGPDNWLSFSGLFLLLLFLGLSAYAGYEIALFRHQPAKIVCVLSAIFPVIIPLVVFFLPDPAEAKAEVIAQENDHYIIHQKPPSGNDPALTEFPEYETQISGSVVDAVSISNPVAVESYSSGKTHFSDRFFSDHLSRFYQSASGQGETLYIKTAETSVPVHHISALEPESLNVVYALEGEWLEQTLEYSKIVEVCVHA